MNLLHLNGAVVNEVAINETTTNKSKVMANEVATEGMVGIQFAARPNKEVLRKKENITSRFINEEFGSDDVREVRSGVRRRRRVLLRRKEARYNPAESGTDEKKKKKKKKKSLRLILNNNLDGLIYIQLTKLRHALNDEHRIFVVDYNRAIPDKEDLPDIPSGVQN